MVYVRLLNSGFFTIKEWRTLGILNKDWKTIVFIFLVVFVEYNIPYIDIIIHSKKKICCGVIVNY